MMVERSEQIGELAAALAKAQGEMENAPKLSENPFFKSKYADLAGILNVVRPCLSANGIAVIQHPSFDNGTVTVQTALIHSSGQWSSSSISSPVAKADAQGIGSAITYCRRYSLAALSGVAQEDDDGNAATKKTPGAGAEDAPTVNLDDAVVKTLRDAKTMDELKAAWEVIAVGVRHGYAGEKDAAKVRITEVVKEEARKFLAGKAA